MTPAFFPAILTLVACISEPGTTEFPGDITNFDPIAGIPAIAAFAGPGAELKEIDLGYVRADGTMNFDVEGYYPRAEYSFGLPTKKAPDAPPGTPGHDQNEGIEVSIAKPTWRHVTSRGGGCNYEGNFWFGGMEQRSSSVRDDEPTIAPKCSLAKLFARAHQEGVSTDAVGDITIDDEGYELTVNAGGFVRVVMDHDCKRAETDDERRDREKDERDAERDREREREDREREDRQRDGKGGKGGKGKGGKGKAGKGKGGKGKHR